MKRLSLSGALVAAMAIAAISPSALALTITFNSVPSSGNPIVTSVDTDGYNFSSFHFHTIDSPSSSSFGGAVTNGTIDIAEEAGSLGGPITMSKIGGGTFTLNGLDAGPNFIDSAAAAAGGFPNAVTLSVLGNLSGGGTVSTSLSLVPSVLTTFTLPSTFTNLTSVTFSGVAVTGGTGGIALDNIVVNGGTPVPLPAAAPVGVLMVVGTAVMTRLRRKAV